MEWKLPTGDVWTREFHADRSRAPHWEHDGHRPRLERARDFILDAAANYGPLTVSDLGAGDGGLLAAITGQPGITSAWGYDFCPANVIGARERGVIVLNSDFTNDAALDLGDLTVMTEVLEHMLDPHGWLSSLALRTSFLVASSPFVENAHDYDSLHAWAFDMDGYRDLIEDAGFAIERHESVGRYQVVLARC